MSGEDHVTQRSHNLSSEYADAEEEFGNELGGARALLQLGNKSQPNDIDVEAAVIKLVGNIENHVNSSPSHNNAGQQPYLGGSSQNRGHGHVANQIANNNNKRRKLQLTDDIVMNEFQQWTGFLEEELNASAQNASHAAAAAAAQVSSNNNAKPNDAHLGLDDEGVNNFLDEETFHSAPSTPRKSKKHKKASTDLSHLDSTTDHEQLVQAAIANAKELENEFGPMSVQAFLKDQQHQQQQQHVEMDTKKRKTKKKLSKSESKKRKGLTSKENEALVAEVVSQNQAWLTAAPPRSRISENMNEIPKVKPDDDVGVTTHIYEEEQESVRSKGQTSAFSAEETSAIDAQIMLFCKQHSMTREQVCQRIWSNKREKDQFWETLRAVLPNRTRASLYKHVRRSYHIFPVRAKWSAQEDKELGRLAAENPGNWKRVGEVMGRMPEDCRDRFRNYVKCGENRLSSKWSLHEEIMLKAIVLVMKEMTVDNGDEGEANNSSTVNWTLVSEEMGGRRSRIQCRYKWNKLTKNKAKALLTKSQKDGPFQDGIIVRPSEERRHVWLLQHLKDTYSSEANIDWDVVVTLYPFVKDEYQTEEFLIDSGKSLRIYYEMIKLKYLNDNYDWDAKRVSFTDKLGILIERVKDLTST